MLDFMSRLYYVGPMASDQIVGIFEWAYRRTKRRLANGDLKSGQATLSGKALGAKFCCTARKDIRWLDQIQRNSVERRHFTRSYIDFEAPSDSEGVEALFGEVLLTWTLFVGAI